MTAFETSGTLLIPDDLCGRLESSSREVELLAQVSRAPRLPWWERDDIYEATELFENPNPRFYAHGRYVQQAVDNAAGVSKLRMVWGEDLPGELSPYVLTSPTVARIVAWLAAYHHSTTTQVAAATGFSVSTVRDALRKMWVDGLVERASFDTGRWRVNAPQIWKLRDGKHLRWWVRSLPLEKWLSVTAGANVGAGPSHLRHNLLVVELALRAAEVHGDLQAIFGETLALPELLLPEAGKSGFRGDLVLVRGDGLRIVVELVQSSRQAELEAKMARWGSLLMDAERAWHETGTVVVFVAASRTDHRSQIATLQRAHAAGLTAERLMIPGAMEDDPRIVRARASILIADYGDWFPSRWKVSEDFAQLRAVVWHAGQRAWVRTSLASESTMRFKPAEAQAWTAPKRYAPEILSVPAFLGRELESYSPTAIE